MSETNCSPLSDDTTPAAVALRSVFMTETTLSSATLKSDATGQVLIDAARSFAKFHHGSSWAELF